MNTLDHFIDVHMKHIQDAYSKVIKEVQDSLRTFVHHKHELLVPHLKKLIPVLLIHMVDDQELLSASSSDLISELFQYYESE